MQTHGRILVEYYKDAAGRMDAVGFADAAAVNEGLAKRKTLARQSREFDMMGRQHADLFFQARFMLNEVGVKIKLIRSRDAFCLMGAASKVRIIHASMFVRKVKLMPLVTPRLWRTELQSIPYVAWCVRRSQYHKTIWMSPTRNCFPVNSHRGRARE